jgi:O-antigen/teichoic acid export membrane protein
LIRSIKNYFNRGQLRSVKAKKNIVLGLGFKTIGIAAEFLKVPLFLLILDAENYGVWLTIVSILQWVVYFDFGLGHGLRNNLVASITKNDILESRKLISTTYYYVSLISLSAFILLLPLIFIADWQAILNSEAIQKQELIYSVIVVFVFFISRFVLSLIGIVLKANQRPALADSFIHLGSLFSLITLLAVYLLFDNSLLTISLAITVPQLAVYICGNLFFYNYDYADLRPKYSLVDKELFNKIFTLGIKFFIIQLGGLVIFSSSNIILAQTVNPSEVSIFNVTKQYFGLPMMIFTIVVVPFWSAITEAYQVKDFVWINNAIKKLNLLATAFVIILVAMLVVSDMVFSVWLADSLIISFDVTIAFVILNVFSLYVSPLTSFINGVGKLELSLYVVIFKTLLFIPVAVILSKLYGATGLVVCMILINSIPSAILEYIQYKKIVSGNIRGVWGR